MQFLKQFHKFGELLVQFTLLQALRVGIGIVGAVMGGRPLAPVSSSTDFF